MAGAITRRFALWLLAAGLLLAPRASAAAAEPVAPAAPVAGSKVAAPAEAINLYDEGDRAGAPEKRATPPKSSALSMVARTGFWLGLVIALICGLVALARKVLPKSAAWGQSQTAELVGRTYLEPKRSVYLLKVGNRVLVVGSAENGLSSLGEITDRTEVDYLTCLARGRLAVAPGRKSDFSRILGKRLARLVGLAKDSDEQLVEDDELAAEESAAARAGAVGATAAPGGVETLKEQLARLKRIS
jgi:flagellar biogenesis protein FliO